ncbi:hypothetical protein KDL67_10840 [bacterium]|nr:hypothetical protein [bacterium]
MARKIACGMILAVLALARPAAAADCVDYTGLLRLVSTVPAPGSAWGLALEGETLYSVGSSLRVFDLADPATPQLRGTTPLGASAHRVAVSGDRACALTPSTLYVLDVGDPDAPQLLGSLDYGGPLTTDGTDLDVAGDLVAIAALDGLLLVDVSTPSAPQIAFFEDSPAWDAWEVALRGSVLCVIGATAQLQAYALRCYDVGDPQSPQLLGELVLEDSLLPPSFLPYQLLWDDDRVTIAGAGCTVLVDLADPGQPALLGALPYGGLDMARDADRGYFVHQDLRIVDLDGSLVPSLLDGMVVGAVRVEARGGYAYLACQNTVQVADARHLGSPQLGRFLLPGEGLQVQDLEVADQRLHIAADDAYLIVDAAEPRAPRLLHAVDLSAEGGAADLALHGNYAYVAQGAASSVGVRIYDVRASRVPRLVGTLPAPDFAMRVTVHEGRLYAATHGADPATGMAIYGLDHPEQPALLGFLPLDYTPRYVAVENDHAVVTNVVDLNVVDVKDPANPILTGSVQTPGPADHVLLRDGFAYVEDYYGVRIVDVHDSALPRIVGEYVASPVYAQDIALAGDFLYVAAASYGLLVLDVSDPTLPTLVTTLTTERYNDICTVGDGVVFFEEHWLGQTMPEIKLFPVQCGEGRSSRAGDSSALTLPPTCFPNPSRGGGELRFDLPRGMQVRVAVYDVSGRLVRELGRRELQAGPQTLRWDGLDGGGRPVPAGAYMIRAQAADGSRWTARSIQLR